MAELILKSNSSRDRALINQVKKYKQDKTVHQLADKNFTAVAEAVTLGQDGKITLTQKSTNYEIIPFEDCISALCDGISKQGYGPTYLPMHLVPQSSEASHHHVQTGPFGGRPH